MQLTGVINYASDEVILPWRITSIGLPLLAPVGAYQEEEVAIL